MKFIEVRLREAKPRDELFPQYDEDADLLEVRSRVPKAWPFGIDIDGAIIIDVDAELTLANVDLLIPRSLWRVR